jgi:hypothetical protein
MPEAITVKATRDDTITTLVGVIMPVTKGKTYKIRPDILNEAIIAGCLPLDKAEKTEDDTIVDGEVEGAGQTKEEQIIEAMQTVLLANKPEDFTTKGVPSNDAIKEILGFVPDNLTKARCWKKVKGA